jgi:hypothetical protein
VHIEYGGDQVWRRPGPASELINPQNTHTQTHTNSVSRLSLSLALALLSLLPLSSLSPLSLSASQDLAADRFNTRTLFLYGSSVVLSQRHTPVSSPPPRCDVVSCSRPIVNYLYFSCIFLLMLFCVMLAPRCTCGSVFRQFVASVCCTYMTHTYRPICMRACVYIYMTQTYRHMRHTHNGQPPCIWFHGGFRV